MKSISYINLFCLLALAMSQPVEEESSSPKEARWGGYGGGYGGLSSVSVVGGVFPLPCDCLSRCVSYKDS